MNYCRVQCGQLLLIQLVGSYWVPLLIKAINLLKYFFVRNVSFVLQVTNSEKIIFVQSSKKALALSVFSIGPNAHGQRFRALAQKMQIFSDI